MDLKAIIVEDEDNSRITLFNMITNFCEGVKVVEQVDSVKTAVTAIREYQPDLVFLDIEMPEQNGFKLFDYFESPDFDIIFTTAYNQYAVRAFRFAAIDYLLKPINLEELRESIKKVAEKRQYEKSSRRINLLRENLNNFINKLALPTNDGYIFIELKEIIHCEAQGNYTVFHLISSDKVVISKTLKVYSELLEEFNFFRINRSNLINLNHVRKYGRQKSPMITLSSGVSLVLSETRKKEFLERIERL
ncbi:MAG: LytTR family DNA-binding domain-containing protein [Bacteroidota bacterium]